VDRGYPRRLPRREDLDFVRHPGGIDIDAGAVIKWGADMSTRYTLCLFVDKRCIEFLMATHDPTDGYSSTLPGHGLNFPIVGVLSRHWLPLHHPETRRFHCGGDNGQDRDEDGVECYEHLVDNFTNFPPVEGCCDADLGWIYHWSLELVQLYRTMGDAGGLGWGGVHETAPPRPPARVWGSLNEEDYGFGECRGDVEEGHSKGLEDMSSARRE
jgi:hypothetical protein